MNQSDPNIPIDPKDIQSADDIDALKAQMIDMQMEIDILKETINVLKKDPGVNREALSNREKAVIIDALKDKYSLPKLCRKLCISRSSYYYQETAMCAEDKYSEIRVKICELFHNNYNAFGYRKIYKILCLSKPSKLLNRVNTPLSIVTGDVITAGLTGSRSWRKQN